MDSFTIQNRISEARERDENGGVNIILLHGFEAAMVGTTVNQHGKTVAVYEEELCLQILMNLIKTDHPDVPKNELYSEAIDAWDYNTMRALPYMGEAAPVIIQGFEVDSTKWDALLES